MTETTYPPHPETMTTTPVQPFSNLRPIVKIVPERKLVFERVAMKAGLVALRRSLQAALQVCDQLLEVCA